MDLEEQLRQLILNWRQRASEINTGDDRADCAKDDALCSCAKELEDLLG